ncbi:hypothetical protein [Mucilaginibacter lappiensis]|uniref:hypothetical protein n=1 Tax=Mucilaginibacter lappiensis TaxID=354630 RepID=UPI00158E1DCF|nr:hypothetical protein [Mucilaginibacter lappiensis]
MSPENPKDEMMQAEQFLNLLADIYLYLPKPATEYYSWPDIVDKGLHDLGIKVHWK